MSATGDGPGYWKMFEPRVPGFVHVQTCYPYRYQGATPGESVGQAAARELEEAILREGPDTVAAFIGEPIHGAGGVFYPTDDYWPRVREVCTRHDVLLIDDEIITGFCRTGRWFGLSHWNVTPDILSFAKGVTSGYLPLGGIMVTRRDQGSHGCGRRRPTLDARVYELGPSHLLRGRAEEHRDHAARAAVGERGADGRAAPGRPHGGVRRSAEHRRHPRREGPARGRGVRRGSGDQEELRARPEVRRDAEGGDDEARRHHADAARRPALIPRRATSCSSPHRSSSPRRTSIGWSASRTTPSRRCLARDMASTSSDCRPSRSTFGRRRRATPRRSPTSWDGRFSLAAAGDPVLAGEAHRDGSTGRTAPTGRARAVSPPGVTDAIVAHAAAWPVRVCVPGSVVPAAHLIDWAADPDIREPASGSFGRSARESA